jgi:2-polyprenyl-6-methoxyphenol hydroxylase-like FAD-dependent oxidoreductase
VKADLVVGTDGAFSKVRRELMRATRMNFAQEFIEHGYVELNMPPDEKGEYKMDPNHLHIWPRQTFMMIALPNVVCIYHQSRKYHTQLIDGTMYRTALLLSLCLCPGLSSMPSKLKRIFSDSLKALSLIPSL